MIDTHEPKDGDFIAYIEQLQRESAARLLSSTQHRVVQLEGKPAAGHKADQNFASHKPSNQRSAAEMHPTLAQIASMPSLIGLFASIVPILGGTLFALYWLVASASFWPLLIGIVLITWGARHFERARKRLSQASTPHAQTLVSKVFTAPSKTK